MKRALYRPWLGGFLFLLLTLPGDAAPAADLNTAFAQANQLYEAGKFPAAAAAYQDLIAAGRLSAALYFNLGNSHFKSGQTGRAIAAYRRAEELAPRDPDLQANLKFARRVAQGGTAPKSAFWRRWLATLTLNEWCWLAAGTGWLWFLLLIAGRWQAAWKKKLGRYPTVVGAGFALLLVCATAALSDADPKGAAIVVVPEAVVRYGPLPESPQFYRLHDGAEVRVLDQDREWLQVIDAVRRKGWLLREQVLLLYRQGIAPQMPPPKP